MSESTFYEPPSKKIKYEPNWYMFDVGYLTENGIILSENIIQSKPNSNSINNIKPILHIQCVEGADVYIIANMKNNYNSIDITEINNSLIDINKSYTLNEIFTKLKNGDFSIGTIQHYGGGNNMYIKNMINNITDYYDDDNNELRLHYTASHEHEDNVAWRTIKWDLFSEQLL